METRKLTMIAFSVFQNDDQFHGLGRGLRGAGSFSYILAMALQSTCDLQHSKLIFREIDLKWDSS